MTTTLVIGGTGTSGRRVARKLHAQGVDVRVGSRTSATRFDWGDDATWMPALRGASAAYLTYHPDIGHPDAAEKVAAFAKLAVDGGTHRLVLLSGRGSEHAQRAEQALAESGAEWTVVRSSFFAQNFDEGMFRDGVRSGEIAFPAGAVAEPFISADDVADVAVAALTDPRHIGRVYDVTGPRLLTFAEAAAEISQATGRKVRYTPITFTEFGQVLAGLGLPDDAVRETVDVFAAILDGRNSHVSDGVRQALGRPPIDFADHTRSAAWT